MVDDAMNQNTSDQRAASLTEMEDKLTRWAADRTRWAADNTFFIAWLRAAISMIGIGIGLGKAGDALESEGIVTDSYHGLQILGTIFILLAVVGLIGALIQDIRIAKRLASEGYGRVEPTPISQVMGFLVLAFGILGVIFVFV